MKKSAILVKSGWKGGGTLPVLLTLLLTRGWAFDVNTCPPLVCTCSADPEPAADCSGRRLSSIPPGLSRSLTFLDLGRNTLRVVNATYLLERLENLETLSLKDNGLTSFYFSGVHRRLKKLDLSGNQISSISRDLGLMGLAGLKELNLAENKIQSLPRDSFQPLGSSLKFLSLKQNRVENLEEGSLDGLNHLLELSLSKNRLSSFPKSIFKDLKNLEVLDMNKNRFKEIKGLSFLGLDSLRVLELKRNKIGYLMDGAFFGLKNIEELHLDRNRVDQVNKGWLFGVTTLRHLSLNHNKVEFIVEDGWEYCEVLDVLDLRSNKLQLLDRESFMNLPRVRKLYLQNNFIEHLESPAGGPGVFSDVPLLEELYLDGNKISESVEDADSPFRSLHHLKVLSLSRNQIKSIGISAFRGGLENLETLDLRDNVISTMQENSFDPLPSIKEIKLDSESILCDCYFKWFPKWLNETDVRGCEAKCAHPESLKNRNVVEVAYETYTCDDFPKPYFIKQPESQIALKSDDLVLYCRVASTSSANMTFRWRIDSFDIEARQEFGGCDSEERKRCVVNRPHSFDGHGRDITSELRLKDMSYKDAGKYQCIVSNKFGASYSDKANITVYVYPSFVVKPEEVTVETGQTASMKCAARGVPTPKVKWAKDSGADFPAARERRIRVNTLTDPSDEDNMVSFNSFDIRHVKAEDAGTYACTATNPAGSISWNISLVVLEMPKFVKHMTDRVVALGDSAVFECMSGGSPAPELTWYKDGSHLEPTERHFFAADNQLLVVVKASESDAGRYECRMHNKLGTVAESAELTVLPEKGTGGFDWEKYNITYPFNPLTSNDPKDGDEGEGGVKTTFIIIITTAVIGFLAVLLLIWLMVFFFKNRKRRYQRPGEEVVHAQPRPSQSSSHHSAVNGDSSRRDSAVNNQHVRQFNNSTSDLGSTLEPSGMSGAGRSFDVSTRVDSPEVLPEEDVVEMQRLLQRTDQVMANSGAHYYSSSERDSGTGDSKKSDQDEEEPVYENYQAAAGRGDGAGESAMSLEEFEHATKTTFVLEDGEEDDSAICGGRTTFQTENGSNEQLLLAEGSGCGEEELIYSSVGSTASSKSHSDVKVPKIPDQTGTFTTFYPRGKQYRTASQSNISSLEEDNRYLALHPPRPPSELDDVEAVDPKAHRGGVGARPRRASLLELHQKLLEESLNNSDHVLDRRKNASRTSLVFKRSDQNSNGGQKMNSLPRRSKREKYKRGAGAGVRLDANLLQYPDQQHSRVAEKSSDQFFA